MSKAEILSELPKLSKEDRYEIRVKLAEMDSGGWLDEDDPLTEDQKALLDARLKAHEQDPDSAIPWEEFEASLRRELGE